MKTLRILTLCVLTASATLPAFAQALRPEVGKPLQQAGDLLRAGKGREALAKVREADAVAGKTPAEQLVIDRMKGAAAQRAGDHAAAAQAFEAVFASGKLAAAEQAQTAESLAFTYAQLKDWNKAGHWADKAQGLGSSSPQLKQLQTYVRGQSGDYAAVARDAPAAVAAAEQAGRRPDEGDLLRLADAYQRTGNGAGHIAALEKLVAHYGKKEYWSAYLGRITRKSGFSDRLALDVMRLKLETGNLDQTGEYMEMAQLAIQAGFPAEAKKIIDKGFATGKLGNGPEAERHKRLRDLAIKREVELRASIGRDSAEAADKKDGNDLVQVGLQWASLGEPDKGLKLVEDGIAKGGLKRPDDARLHLGIANLKAGRQSKALAILRGVNGKDGTGDLSRLWATLASR